MKDYLHILVLKSEKGKGKSEEKTSLLQNEEWENNSQEEEVDKNEDFLELFFSNLEGASANLKKVEPEHLKSDLDNFENSEERNLDLDNLEKLKGMKLEEKNGDRMFEVKSLVQSNNKKKLQVD